MTLTLGSSVTTNIETKQSKKKTQTLTWLKDTPNVSWTCVLLQGRNLQAFHFGNLNSCEISRFWGQDLENQMIFKSVKKVAM